MAYTARRITVRTSLLRFQESVSDYGLRKYKTKMVKAGRWPKGIQIILVVKVGSVYDVIDGVHRGTAAIEAGLKSIPVMAVSREVYDDFLEEGGVAFERLSKKSRVFRNYCRV